MQSWKPKIKSQCPRTIKKSIQTISPHSSTVSPLGSGKPVLWLDLVCHAIHQYGASSRAKHLVNLNYSTVVQHLFWGEIFPFWEFFLMFGRIGYGWYGVTRHCSDLVLEILISLIGKTQSAQETLVGEWKSGISQKSEEIDSDTWIGLKCKDLKKNKKF